MMAEGAVAVSGAFRAFGMGSRAFGIFYDLIAADPLPQFRNAVRGQRHRVEHRKIKRPSRLFTETESIRNVLLDRHADIGIRQGTEIIKMRLSFVTAHVQHMRRHA